MRALPTPSANDRPRFHMNMLVSELIERDTRAIEASVVSSAPLVAETKDGVMRETWLTPIRPQAARGLEPPDPRLRDQSLKGGSRRARGRLVSNKSQGENVDEPQWPCPTLLRSGQGHLDLSCLILTSSQAHRISIEERSAGHPSQSNGSSICQEAG